MLNFERTTLVATRNVLYLKRYYELKIMIWKNGTTDAIIIFRNGSIYKGELGALKFEEISTNHETDLSHLSSLPISYITRVEMEKGKNRIQLFYKEDTSFDLSLDSGETCKEVFSQVHKEIPSFQYSKKTISSLDNIKKPLISVVIIIFLFVISIIVKPDPYDPNLSGFRGESALLNLFYGLNSLGSHKLILIFSGLAILPLINIWRKVSKDRIVEILK